MTQDERQALHYYKQLTPRWAASYHEKIVAFEQTTSWVGRSVILVSVLTALAVIYGQAFFFATLLALGLLVVSVVRGVRALKKLNTFEATHTLHRLSEHTRALCLSDARFR